MDGTGDGGQEKQQQLDSGTTKKEETINVVPFYKLFTFADSTDKILMIVGTLAAIINGASQPFMIILIGDLTDTFGLNYDKDVVKEVAKVSLKFVYLAIGCGIVAFFQVACWMISGERQASRIRSLYLKTILRQDVGFFDTETNTGEIIGRISGDTVIIQDAMGEKVGKCIQLASTFFGSLLVAFMKGWLLTLVMLSSLPLLVINGGVLALVVSKMASRAQEAYAKAAVIVEQTIGSIRTVASFSGEKKAMEDYEKCLEKAYECGLHKGFASGLAVGIIFLTMFSTYALAVWFGSKMILEKDYTGGEVLIILFTVIMGSMSLGEASPCMIAFAAGRAAAFKMFETINRVPDIDTYDTKGKILDEIRGEIELRNVYFSYPARPEEQIFRGFSLSIPSGTTAALVGESGSGKSTVVSLIERFYDPQDGEIFIDGINLKEFQLKWIRQKIGLVSQEPVLFSVSIKDNIAYGKEGATIEEIQAAAELANASEFIDELPQGLDSMVGEHGTQLSGGQKQRVAIARAILKDPRILLLDEATSALDAESERIVQEALDRIMVNRTTLIVAHRLSTIRNADTIAVVHKGMIVEKGTHSELLRDTEGFYSQLISLQGANKDTNLVNKDKSATLDSSTQSSERILSICSITRESLILEDERHSVSALLEPEDSLYEELESPKKVPLRRLAYLSKPEIPVFIGGAICAIINGAIFPIFALLLAGMIQSFYKSPSELRKDSKFWALMFIVLGVVSSLAKTSMMYLFCVADEKLIRRIRSMCFNKLVYMEVGWFDKTENSSGIIGARLSTEATTLRALVGDKLSQHVQNVSSLVLGLAIAFKASWELALIILSMVPLLLVSSIIQEQFMKGFGADSKAMYEEASQVASDAVGSIRTVASFCGEEKAMELYREKCEGPLKSGIKLGLFSGLGFGVSFALLYLVYATSFYAGAVLIKDGKITFSDVYRVIFVLILVAVSISNSSRFGADPSKAKSATTSVFAILDRKSEIDTSDVSGITLNSVKGEIKLENVSFKYPSRPDVQIFRDFCLTIHSGKTVALVGESGSGKSTVISLLQRFYNPDSGHITLDGINIQKLQLKWLRQQMGLVSQEPVLFNETIRANIAYGKEENASEAEIVAAAKLANAHNFISGLQQGYDTVVGEQGVQLSGGQKQRVAIARAMIKNPKLLLLDEATSALDAESERVVQDALDEVMMTRTTIVVAHRLSTIKGADLIAVVKNGVIVEQGNHQSLLNVQDGLYASLVSLHVNASS